MGRLSEASTLVLGLLVVPLALLATPLLGDAAFQAAATSLADRWADNITVEAADYIPWYQASAAQCDGLHPALLAAQGYVESGFNPHAVSPSGAQGIAQFLPATYTQWGRDDDGDGVNSPLDPQDAIMAQGRLMCSLLNQALETRLPGDIIALALAGYHAGWNAVLTHRGIPPYPETQDYVQRVSALATAWATGGAQPAPVALPPPPQPYTGGPGGGCTQPDPTGGACLTPATAWAYTQIKAAFGDVWTSVGCQQPRAAGGAHPLGRACDYAPGPIGVHPTSAQQQLGWTLAHWLRAHAEALDADYIIWAGRIWSTSNPTDVGGWGRPFNGGLCGNPYTITCGHYDHVHVSYRPN